MRTKNHFHINGFASQASFLNRGLGQMGNGLLDDDDGDDDDDDDDDCYHT